VVRRIAAIGFALTFASAFAASADEPAGTETYRRPSAPVVIEETTVVIEESPVQLPPPARRVNPAMLKVRNRR